MISFLEDNVLVDFLKANKDSLSEDQRNALQAMLLCHDPSQGYATFLCPECGEKKIIHHSCNSRLCPSCGKHLTDEWAKRISRHLLMVPHRHVVLTLPNEIWPLMKADRSLIDVAAKQILVLIRSVFEYFIDKLKRTKIIPGITCVLHTFGEDLKFNVHFHCLVTSGGINEEGDWINIDYFPYKALREVWQYEVLTALKEALPKTLENSRFINKMFDDHPKGFYVYAPDTVKNDVGLLEYISRYVRHPAIAQSRIRSFDGKDVVFVCKDKEKREYDVKMDVQSFLSALIQHIPPKGYQLVRHLGLYANKSRKKYAAVISKFQKIRKLIQKKLLSSIPTCPKCLVKMEFMAITAPSDPPHHLLLSNYENQTTLRSVANLRHQALSCSSKSFGYVFPLI